MRFAINVSFRWVISGEITAGYAIKLNDFQDFRNASKYKERQRWFTNLSEFIKILTHACVGIFVHVSSARG